MLQTRTSDWEAIQPAAKIRGGTIYSSVVTARLISSNRVGAREASRCSCRPAWVRHRDRNGRVGSLEEENHPRVQTGRKNRCETGGAQLNACSAKVDLHFVLILQALTPRRCGPRARRRGHRRRRGSRTGRSSSGTWPQGCARSRRTPPCSARSCAEIRLHAGALGRHRETEIPIGAELRVAQ
jgi:hypothetical protein